MATGGGADRPGRWGRSSPGSEGMSIPGAMIHPEAQPLTITASIHPAFHQRRPALVRRAGTARPAASSGHPAGSAAVQSAAPWPRAEPGRGRVRSGRTDRVTKLLTQTSVPVSRPRFVRSDAPASSLATNNGRAAPCCDALALREALCPHGIRAPAEPTSGGAWCDLGQQRYSACFVWTLEEISLATLPPRRVHKRFLLSPAGRAVREESTECQLTCSEQPGTALELAVAGRDGKGREGTERDGKGRDGAGRGPAAAAGKTRIPERPNSDRSPLRKLAGLVPFPTAVIGSGDQDLLIRCRWTH